MRAWPARCGLRGLVWTGALVLHTLAGTAGTAPVYGDGDAYPGPGASFAPTGPARYLAPLVPAAHDSVRQGFVRVINRSDVDGRVRIDAVDDEGYRYAPLFLSIEADGTSHFNSEDIEYGNAAKGLLGALGAGQGSWRLALSSELNIEVLAYIRNTDGFLTSMHDVVPGTGDRLEVATFNPASNTEQASRLRLINLGDTEARVAIHGIDDVGESPGAAATTRVPAGAAREFSARELESGGGLLDGALRDGTGKWRLVIDTNGPVVAMSLLENPAGHLTNLSSGPVTPDAEHWHSVPFFPGAPDGSGRQGFLRIVNRAAREVRVELECRGDGGGDPQWVYVPLAGGHTVHLNSDDLANGSPDKGLYGGLCPAEGDWHIRVWGGTELQVLAYVRTRDGFLTSIHDVAPHAGLRHHVGVFNPGSNVNQASRLRVVNPGEADAAVEVFGVDDAGASPGDQPVRAVVRAGRARTLAADHLEAGSAEFEGALGDGRGKWQLRVEADSPVVAMSLLESTATGTLTNLSSVAGRAAHEVLSVAENTWPDEPVGAPVVIDLGQDDMIEYRLSGPDADAFAIEPASGQIRTATDAAFDYETDKVFHWLTVEAHDGDRTAHVRVRVDVTNVLETPAAPNPPSATSVSLTDTRLAWGEPDDGGAPIVDYDYRYRAEGDLAWTEVVDTAISGTEVIVEGLAENGRYQVQIRAVNADGPGPWSDTALIRLWPPAPDVQVSRPWHFTNIWMDFDEAPTDFDTFCLTVAVEIDVYGRIPIYISPFNQKINKLGFYAGIQTDIRGFVDKANPRFEARGRGAIFSRWEERDLDAIREAPGGLHESSGYEGNFISVRNDLAWSRGSYELCLVKADRVDGEPLPEDYEAEDIAYGWGRFVHTWVRFEVTEEASGETTLVGALAFPGETLALDGTTTVFYEAYGRGPMSVRDLRAFDVVVRDVEVDGEAVHFDLIRERINPTYPDAPVMIDSVYDEGAVSTEVGVFTGAYGTSIKTLYRAP